MASLALDLFSNHKKLLARTGVNASGWLRACDCPTYGVPNELNTVIGFLNFCHIPQKTKLFLRKKDIQSFSSLVSTTTKTLKWMTGFCLPELKPHVNCFRIIIHASSLLSSSCLLSKDVYRMQEEGWLHDARGYNKLFKSIGKITGIGYQFFSLLVTLFEAPIPGSFIRCFASSSIISSYIVIYLTYPASG